MHDFLKFNHNCDGYMGVQKERKSTFLTAFEHREKEARSLFAARAGLKQMQPMQLHWAPRHGVWGDC